MRPPADIPFTKFGQAGLTRQPLAWAPYCGRGDGRSQRPPGKAPYRLVTHSAHTEATVIAG